MEHEKGIEHAVGEIGFHLRAIRDERLYREDFPTFELYCQKRHGMRRDYVDKQIRAAGIVDELHTNVCNVREGTVRSLSLLPTADERREAWAEAVDESDGKPTAKIVAEIVARRREIPKREHPARFSDPILLMIAEHVDGARVVLDPFAGTGRVHELREIAGVEQTIGIEIEAEWAAKHADTIHGDALDLSKHVKRRSVDAIATSPTYGNRMADHHDARDDSVRLTYKHTLGHDLAATNSGAMQWGDEYRDFHQRVWRQAIVALKVGGTFTVNVKNHIRDGSVQRVVEWHFDTLCRGFGLRLMKLDVVSTRGVGAGGDQHTGVEFVATFEKVAS
jgi:hypothetical protein